MGQQSFVDQPPLSDPFEARVGSVVGAKWKLVRLIGVGGMAAVYEGEHEVGRREAVKILHPEVARHEELRARFAQEARAVNRIRHPGVIDVRDVGVTDDGCPFMVMELCQGSSLADLLIKRQVAREQGLDFVDQVLDVLAVAHDASIVHRDIKPDNLFVLPDGRIKVLDFGIARVRHGTAAMVVTRTGTALGTPSYMPPEQIKGVDVDHRADLFAVGAILWELLTGRDVHVATSTQQLMLKMLTTPAEPLKSVAPDLPDGLCQVVDRALAFETFDRYPDARTMQADLREARAGHPPPFAAARPAGAGAPSGHATMAHTPHALSRVGVQAAAPSSSPLTLAQAPGARALDHDKERSTKRILAAVMIGGVGFGALVTALLLFFASDASTAETTDETSSSSVSRSRRRQEVPASDASAADDDPSASPSEPAPKAVDPTPPSGDPSTSPSATPSSAPSSSPSSGPSVTPSSTPAPTPSSSPSVTPSTFPSSILPPVPWPRDDDERGKGKGKGNGKRNGKRKKHDDDD